MDLLSALTYLHVADWPGDERPKFGEGTVLLSHAADLRRLHDDQCYADCSGYGGPPHHHFLANVGRGFLGVLEDFAEPDDIDGVRRYTFPVGGPRHKGPSLWRIGKSGRLATVFLPAKLGEPSVCREFNARQHCLLDVLVREMGPIFESGPVSIVWGGPVRGLLLVSFRRAFLRPSSSSSPSAAVG